MSERGRTQRANQSAVDLAKRRFGSERDVEGIFGIPRRTLQKHRFLMKGLPFYRYCGKILYDLDQVEAIIRNSTSGGAAA
jgi:hypothetical protein